MPFEKEHHPSSRDEFNTSKESKAIALMKQRLSGFETEQGRLYGLSYKPIHDNEVVITTTPKAGTTWMQQICHQLRSAQQDGGDMTFDEISQVVPWLELAYDQGQDLYEPQYGHSVDSPRIFKSHAWANHCPKFPKTIVVIRHPYDVVVSFYKFFEDWFFDSGTISLDAFAKEFWLARGIPTSKMENASYFIHLTSWFERRNDPNILFVCFEDLLDDLEKQIRRVASFISTEKFQYDQPDIIKIAVEKSNYEYMKQHSYHFDEKISKQTRNEACGLSPDAGMKKGKIAEGQKRRGDIALSKEIKNGIDEKWKDIVLPVTGCSSYEELRKQLNEL